MLRSDRPRPRDFGKGKLSAFAGGDSQRARTAATGFRQQIAPCWILLVCILALFATIAITGTVPWRSRDDLGPDPQPHSLAAALVESQVSPPPAPSHCPKCWTVVWLIAMEWEVYYVKDVLQHLPLCQPTLRYNHKTYQTHGKPLNLPNHTILVTNYKSNGLLLPAVRQLKEANHSFVTFLLSDEIVPGTNGCSSDRPEHGERIALLLDESRLVLRNYWSPDCAVHDKVLVVPLHVTARDHAGFVEHCGEDFGTPALDRPHFLYFASSHVLKVRNVLVRAIRESVTMASSLDGGQNASVEVYYPFIPPNAQYSRSLSSTRFGVVLSGSNPDTWRFTETLFCGAIPLVDRAVHEYYRQWLPTELMQHVPYFDANASSIQDKLRELLSLSDETYQEWRTQLTGQAGKWYNATRVTVAQRVVEATCEQGHS